MLQTLDLELDRLRTGTALIVPSQAIDAVPVWSPDGTRLAADMAGTWYAIRVDSLTLADASWHGDFVLGVLNSGESVAEAPEATGWVETANVAPRAIRTTGGTSIELRHKRMSTAFVITPPEAPEVALWTSEFENCHSLTLSPDEWYVAFICELNGVFVHRLAQSSKCPPTPEATCQARRAPPQTVW